MTWIIILIIIGTLLFIAELVLLPGVTIAAVAAFCCFVTAITWAFVEQEFLTGIYVLVASLAIIALLTALFFRRRTWKNVALHTDIKEAVNSPASKIEIGAHAKTLSRLAPMGTVEINGQIIEAKSIADFIDPHTTVVVTGIDNFSLIVKPL